MSRKRRKPSPSLPGRLLDGVLGLLMILVVVAFGISIAVRWSKSKEEMPRVEPTRQTIPVPPPVDLRALKARPTVDIRNGCGRAGLAEEMMQRLRGAGFDVVEYRNADRYDHSKTQIRDRSGKPEAALRLKDWLRREFGVGEVADDHVAVPEADLLLILGSDLADTLRQRELRTR